MMRRAALTAIASVAVALAAAPVLHPRLLVAQDAGDRLVIPDVPWGAYSGASLPLTARLVSANGTAREPGGDVRWSTSDPMAAWAADDGTVTFFSSGKITVTARAAGLVATREIDVKSNPVRSVSLGLDGLREMDVGDSLRLKPQALQRGDQPIADAFINLGLSWADSASALRGARIVDHVFRADLPGVYMVIAEFGGQAEIAAIVVRPATAAQVTAAAIRDVNIDAPDFDPYVGTIMPLSARVRLEGEREPQPGMAVTWSSGNPRIAVVASNGTVVFRDAGRVTINAERGERRAGKTFNVQRNPAARINVLSNARDVVPGDEVKLRTEIWARGGQPVRNARVNYAVVSGGNPVVGAVVSENGVFVASRPGIYTIIAELGGLADKATIVVNPPGAKKQLP